MSAAKGTSGAQLELDRYRQSTGRCRSRPHSQRGPTPEGRPCPAPRCVESPALKARWVPAYWRRCPQTPSHPRRSIIPCWRKNQKAPTHSKRRKRRHRLTPHRRRPHRRCFQHRLPTWRTIRHPLRMQCQQKTRFQRQWLPRRLPRTRRCLPTSPRPPARTRAQAPGPALRPSQGLPAPGGPPAPAYPFFLLHRTFCFAWISRTRYSLIRLARTARRARAYFSFTKVDGTERVPPFTFPSREIPGHSRTRVLKPLILSRKMYVVKNFERTSKSSRRAGDRKLWQTKQRSH